MVIYNNNNNKGVKSSMRVGRQEERLKLDKAVISLQTWSSCIEMLLENKPSALPLEPS